ncbi:MAG: nucleoside hydrolase, partial [Erysipelotrichales bacterium]|nr:nucleoside hydrolase [Erysipelotrichales bacterium]
LHDVCPVAYLHEPSLFYGEMAKVHAETEGTITSGKTVTDLWSDKSFAEEANTKVMLEVNREALIRYMTDMLKKIQ